jgi:hypothetical protein
MKQSTDIGFQGGREGPKRHETILKTSQIHLTSAVPMWKARAKKDSPILINVVEILLGVFDLRHALKAGRSVPLSPYQAPKITSSTSSKDEACLANAREKREHERTCTRAQRAKLKVQETKQGRRTEGKVTRYLPTYLPTYLLCRSS